MTVETTTKDKQVTIDVPEDRVAEFYAFYGQFLAGFPGRREERPSRARPHGHQLRAAPPRRARGRRCGGAAGVRPGDGCRLMADKQVTVAVPEERVPEFYIWFAQFLAADPGAGPPRGGPFPRGGRGRGFGFGPPRPPFAAEAWSAQDADQAAWLYGKLAPPARELLDLLIDAPGRRFSGNEIAASLRLDKGAHGVAGILAWPGRYSRKLGREFPIATEGRDDGGTDYYLEDEVASLFAAAREAVRRG